MSLASKSGDREECGKYWPVFNILNVFFVFVFWLVYWWIDELVILVNKKSSGTSAACPVEASVELAGLHVPTSLGCPAPSFPCTTNGFIFHQGAKAAQLRHFITVTRWGARRQDDTEAGWTNLQDYTCILSRLISSNRHECASSLCHVGRQLSLLELLLLVFDWLMGMCLFLKCCEQVNEPWICA